MENDKQIGGVIGFVENTKHISELMDRANFVIELMESRNSNKTNINTKQSRHLTTQH